MTLKDWQDNGWLLPHATSRTEVSESLASAESDIHDARTEGLSPAWSFNIAYNAALRLSGLALAAEGYRAARDSKHYRTIAALDLILKDQVEDLTPLLDRCRTMRHDVTYEGTRSISRGEATELISAVEELHGILVAWLAEEHPDLV